MYTKLLVKFFIVHRIFLDCTEYRHGISKFQSQVRHWFHPSRINWIEGSFRRRQTKNVGAVCQPQSATLLLCGSAAMATDCTRGRFSNWLGIHVSMLLDLFKTARRVSLLANRPQTATLATSDISVVTQSVHGLATSVKGLKLLRWAGSG